MRMAVLHTEGDTVTADTLEFDEMPIADDASLALNDMEKKQIIHALEHSWTAVCPIVLCAHTSTQV